MTEIIQLLGMNNLGAVLIIAILAIVGIYKFIVWCKKTVAQREEFKNENIQKGAEAQLKKDQAHEHEVEEETRLKTLEAAVARLVEVNEEQQKQISLLLESDKNNIKTWIKEQHEKWMALGAIDSQSLDLLETRFGIYEKEGGNSWAHRLMDDIRGLPLITVVPAQPNRQ